MMRELKVDLGTRSYPIYIGEGILEDMASLFEKHGIGKGSPLLIVTDEHVAKQYLEPVTRRLEQAGYKTAGHTVASGEKSKSLSVLEDVITSCLEAGLDRNSTVIALGGGVVGDLAGFVAASYMRGIRFVQIPTTILAHDSSVGGKVAVNHPLAKNIIGAFHQPEMVLYDTATLRTLPDRDVRSGLSEMIKHGLIWDAEFTTWCEDNSNKLIGLDPEALQHGLFKGCSVKAAVVSQDERENDLRAILNLGHTIGHALEAVAGYNELLHGEAISIGMVGAAKLSVRLGNPEHVYTTTKRIFKKFGLPVAVPAHLDTDEIMKAMMHDKKFKEGKMVFIVPTDIGKVEINKNVSADLVRDIVDQLKRED
ncbi:MULTISPECIES: 3-dehydroquinate synthase [unclassified Paenibacillus]|uniref:3-dehydroquinate synthase n=1 Tax=unclassified Paenibacillus TaxID=185978 RepID=UPI001AE7F1D4|nr:MULTISPECIES: 3-dehydroquinate synthase [unclassified Paenibacillus]MBP1155267.1 3-dehydroquinate synthase [Paenibacillus sp. PvP091]MBP1169349.1 3-dehydroquinate synthase [Paenibacillus sp. PvR098]MBP2440377.1 3-dehydroquinate synthase [Paenibacillus sp. PvP052]